MLNKWKSLPQWVQWLFYMPGITSIPLLSCWLLHATFMGGQLPNPFSSLVSLIYLLIQCALFTVFFIKASLALAPKAKIFTSIVVFLLFTIMNLIAAIFLIYSMRWNSYSFVIKFFSMSLLFCIWLLIGIVMLRDEKYEKKVKGTRLG